MRYRFPCSSSISGDRMTLIFDINDDGASVMVKIESPKGDSAYMGLAPETVAELIQVLLSAQEGIVLSPPRDDNFEE
jgi:hypothetical protein